MRIKTFEEKWEDFKRELRSESDSPYATIIESPKFIEINTLGRYLIAELNEDNTIHFEYDPHNPEKAIEKEFSTIEELAAYINTINY